MNFLIIFQFFPYSCKREIQALKHKSTIQVVHALYSKCSETAVTGSQSQWVKKQICFLKPMFNCFWSLKSSVPGFNWKSETLEQHEGEQIMTFFNFGWTLPLIIYRLMQQVKFMPQNLSQQNLSTCRFKFKWNLWNASMFNIYFGQVDFVTNKSLVPSATLYILSTFIL